MGSDTNAHYVSDETDPAKILVEICLILYHLGGCIGTGGGASLRDGKLIYFTPSGVQKERMRPEDIFIYDSEDKKYIYSPPLFKLSACTPLFFTTFRHRDVGACIHTHSANAVMITLLYGKEFKIANIEQIKAIPKGYMEGNLSFFDTLHIPIIDNTAHEEELEPSLIATLNDYPAAPAVLVRRHGLFTWGSTIWKAKIINESLEYLFDIAIRMKQFGLDPAAPIESESS